MFLNKRDIGYSIYSRVESSLRSWISERLSLLGEDWEQVIPNGIWDKILERSEFISRSQLEDPIDALEYTDIPDLEQICFRDPTHILDSIPDKNNREKFRGNLRRLYELRCKIAHVRGSFSSVDLDLLISISDDIASLIGSWGEDINFLLDLIHKDDFSQIISMPYSFAEFETLDRSPIPNNLPPIDYDFDGGFVGRKEDQRRVRELILGELHRVVTIAGAGGVGKTALAHRICNSILERKSQSFDAVVWVSAKEERLTATGIELIEPDVMNYEELINRLLEVFGWADSLRKSIPEKEEDVEVILKCCEKGILLIVDNLETIRDERILEFLKDFPPPNKVLITSRLGLGEVERRYPLKELTEEDSILLIRTLAREKNLRDISRLPDKVLNKYSKKMHRFPLAIKWVLGQVALGKSISTVTDQLSHAQGDIAKFCFEAIFNQLSSDSKLVLYSLASSDTPLSRGVLLHISGLEVDSLDDAANELIIASLIIPEHTRAESDEVILQYRLIPLTKRYLRAKLDSDIQSKREINAKLQSVSDQIEEAHRAKRHYKYAMQDLGASTEEEMIAASYVLTAYQLHQSGNYEESVQMFHRASEIAPKLPRLYRNWAFVESNSGYHVRAEELMEKAISLDDSDPALWFAWGNLEKKRGRLDSSKKKLERASQLSPGDGAIIGTLGEVEKRLGHYQVADDLYKKAAEAPHGRGYRHEVITLTSRADNYRRWGEWYSNDRKYNKAREKVVEGIRLSSKALEIDPDDEKSLWTYRECLKEMISALSKVGEIDKVRSYFDKAFIHNPRTAKEKK
jgi:LuxR family glucitol operon transcriptional activator